MLATHFSPAYQWPVVFRDGLTMRDVAETLRTKQREWLLRLVADHRIKPTPLAKLAGVAATTITRKLYDPDDTAILTDLVIARICEALNVQPPNFLADDAPAARPRGFSDGDAALYDADGETPTARLVSAAIRPGLDPWELKTEALSNAGFRPGDILLMDINATPHPGDVVCAQVYDWNAPQNTRTVFRFFEPPFLVADGPGEEFRRPLLIDNQSVVVKAVMLGSIRARANRPS